MKHVDASERLQNTYMRSQNSFLPQTKQIETSKQNASKISLPNISVAKQ